MGDLTIRMIEGAVRYDVGRRPGTPIEFRELVNMAGKWLCGTHPWRFLEGRSITLRPRASISLTGATWTEATRTLTKTGAFAEYEFLSGDVFEATGVTGATEGAYEVESRTSDDAIVLVESIGAAADGQTDIAGTMANDQIALESDFELQAVTAWSMKNGLVGSFEFTTAQGLLDLRSWPGLSTTISYWGLISYVRSTAGGQPARRLEVWPQSSSSEEKITLFYRGGWKEPATDTEVISIPDWLNLLFIEAVKATVQGYEDPESGSVDRRMGALRAGELFRSAIERDVMEQPDLGTMTGTWTEVSAAWGDRFSPYRQPFIA